MTTLPPLDPALAYFVGVDHGAGPDTAKAVLVNVEPDGKVVVIGEADNTLAGRFELLRALSQSQTVTLPTVDPVLEPIPPAALAAFDLPGNHKKNRAQDRAAGQRGKRTK